MSPEITKKQRTDRYFMKDLNSYRLISQREMILRKEGGSMKTGFIGAGRAGCSLGKYLADHGVELVGYYDKNDAAAKEAAEFTKTAFYHDMLKLVEDSETIFITTVDAQIVPVWEQIKRLPLKNQIICHCSGALSSDSFSGTENMEVSCCSVHPMLPFSSRFSSYEQLNHAFFTVEGQKRAVECVTDLFTSFGNEVCRIDAKEKPKYHAAASMLSNQVVAVLDSGYRLLEECGFTREKAVQATAGLVRGNVENVISQGCSSALTGPVERNDVETIKKHLACLDKDTAMLYRTLAKALVRIAEEKHPEQDYRKLLEYIM